jgi:putative restriction endonuclease
MKRPRKKRATKVEAVIKNYGIMWRRDIHSLFDAGYVTVTPDLDFEVSRRIKEEFENGRHYYALHGHKIDAPSDLAQSPDPAALTWHNENCFRG